MSRAFAALAPVAEGGAAIITGAAGGVGLAAARRFAGLGMPVVLADAPGARLQAAEAAIRNAGGQAIAAPIDLSEPEALAQLRERTLDTFGHIGVAMLNPGSGAVSAGQGNRPDDWRARIDAHVWAAISCVRGFLPALLDSGRPGFLIASRAARTWAADTPSDAVLKTFMEATRQGLTQVRGCRVSAHLLTPGWVVEHGAWSGGLDAEQAAGLTPDEVVEGMLDALDWGDFDIRPRRSHAGSHVAEARRH